MWKKESSREYRSVQFELHPSERLWSCLQHRTQHLHLQKRQDLQPQRPVSQDPSVACGGNDDIDVVTVGQANFTSGENGIIVACRGTLPPLHSAPASILDWIQNFFAEPTSSTSGPYRVPGQVHSGFFDATTAVADLIESLVKGFDPGPNHPVPGGPGPSSPLSNLPASPSRDLPYPGAPPAATAPGSMGATTSAMPVSDWPRHIRRSFYTKECVVR